MALLALAMLGHGIVDPSTPVVLADDVGLTRGDGCFEGLRVRRLAATTSPSPATDGASSAASPPAGQAPAATPPAGAQTETVDLAAHLRRMARSAAGLGIPFDEAAWKHLVIELAQAWADRFPQQDEAAMKLVLTRGPYGLDRPTGFGTISDPPADLDTRRRDGIDVVTLSRGTSDDSFTGAPWLLGGVKTLSYVINMAAQREAAARGAHEALFVTVDGSLLEAPTSSVVWASGHTLRTVADGVGNGILHSITVETLFERAERAGWTTIAGHGQVADLLDAEVAMLLSSGYGPVRIRSLDGKPLPLTAPGSEALAACRRFTDFPELPRERKPNP
ncbi:MAG: aminotransferase class IV [Acidimicrobiaceae bacterium]|nr:aminotransferase class IV [Acidimicrobiaceae bacterium]